MTVALYAIQAAVLVGTVVSMRLCGPNGRWWGWHAATVNQALWGPYIVLSGRWELAVTAVPLAVVFAGNAARSARPVVAPSPPRWAPGCEVFPSVFDPDLPRESMPPIPPTLLAQPPQRAGWCSHGDHCTHHPKET